MQGAKSTLQKLKPFTFDQSFDQEEVWDQDPAYTEAQLKAAKEKAYEEGRSKGVAEGEQAKMGQCHEALKVVSGELEKLVQEQERYLEPVYDQLVQALKHAVNLFLEKADAELALDSLENFLKRTLETLRSKSKVVVYVNPAMTEPLRERMNAVAVELKVLPKHLSFRDDAALGMSDCCLDYEVGGIEKSLGALRKRLNESFQAFHGNLSHRADLVAEEEPEEPPASQKDGEQRAKKKEESKDKGKETENSPKEEG